MATHIVRLQKLFLNMNYEYEKQEKHRLSDRIPMGRILSTLGETFNTFKDVWENLSIEDNSVLLIERLCYIERRESKFSPQAFTAGDISTVTSEKTKFNKKFKYPCKICGKLGHWAKECSKNAEVQKKTTFLTSAFSSSGDKVFSDSWICDSGASVHITPRKAYFRVLLNSASHSECTLERRGSTWTLSVKAASK